MGLTSVVALLLIVVAMIECQAAPSVDESRLLAALYGYEGSPYKRSQLQFKRHISPIYDIDAEAGNLHSLLKVGKRHVSVASDIGGQVQMYNRLFDVGKKRSAISPAYTFQSSLGLSDALENAGKK